MQIVTCSATREFNVQQEKQDITSSDKFGKSVHKGVGYTKIHIRHNILISGKMRYPATPFPRRCWIKQFLLYMDNTFCIMAQSSTAFLVCLSDTLPDYDLMIYISLFSVAYENVTNIKLMNLTSSIPVH